MAAEDAALLRLLLELDTGAGGVALTRLAKRLDERVSVLLRRCTLLGDATIGGMAGPGWLALDVDDGGRWTVRLTEAGRRHLAGPAIGQARAMARRVAIVYPGSAEQRLAATPRNNRFAALFEAFAARGVQAEPVVYADDWAHELRAPLGAMDAVLVWVNPIEAGRSRAVLDALLREVAAAGVLVSTHPDVILKLGTKDVLVDTRDLGWGSDCHRVGSLAQLAAELPARLAGGARVLKQWRGHSGIGIWRVESLEDGPGEGRVKLRHAQRGSAEEVVSLAEAVARMAPYFDAGGHMVDQAWQPRLPEGMLRAYLVQDRVAGFGVQAVVALHPTDEPTPRHYHPAELAEAQDLRRRLEADWLPALQARFGLAREALPMLWDCDFLRGAGEGDWVLCEINVSSVAPFPDSAVAPLVQAVAAALHA